MRKTLPILILTAAMFLAVTLINCVPSGSPSGLVSTKGKALPGQAASLATRPVVLIWNVSYAPAFISVGQQLPYKGDWMAVTVACDWGRNPADVLADVKKVAAAKAKLCLAFGNWPDDSVTAEQMVPAYFAQRGAAVAAMLKPLKAAYPHPPGPVFILQNGECCSAGSYAGTAYSTAQWTAMWTAFFKPVRAALKGWNVEIIAYQNPQRTPVAPDVLFDKIAEPSLYNMGAKAGGVTPLVPNDNWQNYAWGVLHDLKYGCAVNVSQGDSGQYVDSPAWRGDYYADIANRVLPRRLGVQRVIYYCYNGPNAYLYWQATVNATKAAWQGN
jgi:hypothetical protein